MRVMTWESTDVRLSQSHIDRHIVPDNELSDSDDEDGRRDHSIMENDKGEYICG